MHATRRLVIRVESAQIIFTLTQVIGSVIRSRRIHGRSTDGSNRNPTLAHLRILYRIRLALVRDYFRPKGIWIAFKNL